MKEYIFVKAYFQKNLGDDMFVRYLAMRYPQERFVAYANSKKIDSFSDLKNLHFVSKMHFYMDEILCKLGKKPFWKSYYEKRATGCVHIGGSIFIEPSSFSSPLDFYYPENMYFLGCNFGPHKTKEYFDFVHKRLQKAADVCFRDESSYNLFCDLKQARFAPDVLFGYPCYPTIQKGTGIGISVIELENRPSLAKHARRYYEAVAKLMNKCQEKRIPVTLFGFCEVEGDKKAISKIMRLTKYRDANIVMYNGDVDGFLSQYSECEYIIATRFHAMVIGWLLKKKVFPIIYSEKQTAVIKDVGFQGKCWDLQDKEYDVNDLLEDCLNSKQLSNLVDIVYRSQKQFEGLDKFIRSMEKRK